ncbi:MAG TPA: hypothetical protein VK960_10225 [Acidimicrobiia bacterium]|nr:hypothetical protein [Acidimicrobiia bacterium]
MKRAVATALLGGLLVAGCGGGSTDAAEVPPTSEPTVSDGLPLGGDDATFPAAMGPGISVADLIASTLDGPLLVNGYVFVYADGTVVLADMIAESFPPQPAGATIAVEGLDLMQIPITEALVDGEIEITAWTASPVQLIGEIVDGVFVANSVASA